VQNLIWLDGLDLSSNSYGLLVLMVCSIWLHVTAVKQALNCLQFLGTCCYLRGLQSAKAPGELGVR